MEMVVDPCSDNSFRYIMADIDSWHSVFPIGGVVYSTMIVGPRWQRPTPCVTKKARGSLMFLSEQRESDLREIFQRFWPAL
jgi:hypothetical protein